jgi:outer membrane protein OmpA-like peptidoglycan-associated protein
MRITSIKSALCAIAAVAILGVGTLSAAQETSKVKGLIVARDGPNMIVKGEMASWTIALNDDTKVQAIKGTFGLRKETLGFADLVPGLPVEVEMVHIGNGLEARNVKFKADDLKTAKQIQAGLNPTGQQIQGVQGDVQGVKSDVQGVKADQAATNQKVNQLSDDQAALTQKFGQLGDYDVKGQVTVYFAVSSTTLSEDSKQELKQLAGNAVQLKGYMIEVAGYTDSSGNAAYNQKLSDDRAESVVHFLQQECKVPLYRVLAPEGMGESNPAGSNESAQGKKENRRVEVKILVNRGVQQGTGSPS